MKNTLSIVLLLTALAFAAVPVLIITAAAVSSHPHSDCKKNCNHNHPESPPP